MVEIPVQNKQVEKVIKQGIIPREQKRYSKLKKYMDKASKAKTFKGYLQVKRMMAQNLPKNAVFNREEIVWMLKELQDKYRKFEKVGIAFEKSWRGKSGIISIIKEPDRVIIQRAKKSDIGEEPKIINIEITKAEINACIVILGKMQIGNIIESKKVFMAMSRLLGLGHTAWDFGDKPFETDRKQHNSWTTLLGFLDDEGLIKYYRSGKVKLLRDKFSIQEILDEPE